MLTPFMANPKDMLLILRDPHVAMKANWRISYPSFSQAATWPKATGDDGDEKSLLVWIYLPHVIDLVPNKGSGRREINL